MPLVKPNDLLEKQQAQRGFFVVAGVDEVGRGALAGPVVAAAVILPHDMQGLPSGIDDSKRLSLSQREALYLPIQQAAVAWSLGLASRQEIDQYNIRQATLLAMRRAVETFAMAPDVLLLDGRDTLAIDLPQIAVIGGDGQSLSIAAASILAKVYRDRLMRALHDQYPQYGFNQHVGYGTQKHRQAIRSHGPCEAHRMSFRGVQ